MYFLFPHPVLHEIRIIINYDMYINVLHRRHIHKCSVCIFIDILTI